ncbi:outer membrane beta-barrel protein [Helicobacter bilis]|uniref:outer membrane beta-barrel protein n=1 Tax=Helicobacter bilis TaxID=37372 RepID=UPI000CF06C73|nr:outer membrane beta-barrel protein [Helicobacter bilis]
MKKYLVSAVLASTLSFSALNAAEENNGAFVGLHLGGMIAGQMSNGVSLNSSVAVGLKGGYQAFFYDRIGARFYLSGITSYGLMAIPAQQNANATMTVNMNILADLNADMLFDFVSDDDFTSGMYLGFFGGALIDTPVYFLPGTPRPDTKLSTAVGLNIGLRTTVRAHHEFDFGGKAGLSWNITDKTSKNVGGLFYVGASYSYKF